MFYPHLFEKSCINFFKRIKIINIGVLKKRFVPEYVFVVKHPYMEIKCNEKRVDYLLYANKKIAAIELSVFNFPKKGRYYKEECNNF